MTFTAQGIISGVTAVQTVGDEILQVVEGLDPNVALEADTATVVLNLASKLLTKAITTFAAAQGVTDPTPEQIIALLSNPTPLSAPDPS